MSALLAVPALGQGLPLTQSGTITINDAAFELGQHKPRAATPYPGVINTSNLLGTLQKVTVTLPGLSHGYAADVDVLLQRVNDNKRMILLSDVALNFPFNNVTLTIDSAAANSLPEAAAVASGTFKPTNVDPSGDVDDFKLGLTDGVDGPYADALSSLAGSSPNANWRLFVVDDKNQDAGSIAGWTLNLWTTPVFTKVPTTTITTNEDKQISFEVEIDDSDTPPNDLKLLVKSSTNPNLLAPSNVVLTANSTGKIRTLTLFPKQDQFGDVTLTLALEDTISKEGSAITTNVTVRVNAVNDAPTITLSSGSLTTTAARLSTNVVFAKVSDVDNDVNSLTLFAKSSNTNVVRADDVFFVRGSNGTNFFAIAPRGAATGTATLDISVTDGPTTNSTPFNVTVTPISVALFGTGNTLAIPDDGTVVSSTLAVSNIVGNIGQVIVILGDLSHTRPDDLDLVLVGPGSSPKSVALMGQAGGANPISHARLRLANGEPALPDNSQITDGGLTTASYSPADYSPSSLPSPAPAGPYGTALTEFNGTSPNGTWTLYAVDRVTGEAGTLNGGFTLVIYAAPTISNLAATVTTSEDTATSTTFNVADSDGTVTNVTASVVASGVATTSVTRNGGSVTVNITPAKDVNTSSSGPQPVRVVATDNNGQSTTNTFNLVINAVNDAPTISPIAKQITYAGAPVEGIQFTVGDVDNSAGTLTVTATSSNTKLLPVNNIVLGSISATVRTFSLYPVGPQAGTVSVTLTVRDGSNATADSTFIFEVLGPPSPLYANTTPIILQDTGGTAGPPTNAVPSPSSITVSNLVGRIQKVKVTLLGIQHTKPDDMDILLVGPNNHKVMLMSDAGGNLTLDNTQLLFSDDGASLPISSQIASGTYKPTNHDGGDPDTIPNLPSGGTTGTTLDSFSTFNITPNGRWDLWVVDDTGNNVRGAQISGGWMINFVTSPQISDIPNQETNEDTEKRVSFTVGDDQPGVQVDLTATSSNTSVVGTIPLSAFEGTGATRTLRINPVADASGETVITVTVTIGGQTSQDSFTLKVNAVDDEPSVSEITNKTGTAGLIQGPFAFTVSDKETTNPSNIVVTASSSNTDVVPNTPQNLVLTGDGGSRQITIVPNGITTGTSTITIVATDATGKKTPRSFNVTFERGLTYADTRAIEIRDNATSAPYPSTINVSGVSGVVSGIKVTIFGLSHTFPEDANLLLVSPDNSKKVLLLANNGGGAPSNSISGVSVTFDDAASAAPPGPTEGKILTRSYRPSGGTVSTVNGNFPPPAPANPYSATLSSFAGVDPNGDWKLYAFDDTFSDFGQIANGWALVINTAPTILPIANQTTREDTNLELSVFLSDQDTEPKDLKSWAISSDQTLVNDTNLTVLPTNQLTRTLTIKPTANANGTNLITVFVADSTKTNSTQFGLTVVAVDDVPIVTTATNLVVINEDAETNIVFNVSDIDSDLSVTNSTATSAITSIVPNAAANLTNTGPVSIAKGTTNQITMFAKPAANANGDVALTFAIRDASTTVQSVVTLRVNAVNDAPTITGLPSTATNVLAGGSLRDIPFTVGDVETAAKELKVTATSSDQSKIPNANLVLSGANENRLISLTSIGVSTGPVVITVTVDDGNKTTSGTFTVNVNPALGETFANNAAITIRDNNTASTYPSIIPVSNLAGTIHKVSVTLQGFAHTAPDDVDVVLVSPRGQKVLLLSDAGGSIGVTNLQITLDDSGTVIPDNGPLASGVFQPANYSPDESLSGVAPPYSSSLSALKGINPNGDWLLYVVDDTANDQGALTQGWSIKIITAPTIVLASSTPAPIVQDEDQSSSIAFTIADADSPTTPEADLSFEILSQNTTLVPPAGVTLTKGSGSVAGGISYTGTILPGTNQPADSVRATNQLTISVVRKADGARSSIVVTNAIVPINDAPIISRITEKTTEEDRPIDVSFVVSDVDTLPRDLRVVVTSGVTSAISTTNLMLNGQSGANANIVDSLPSNDVVLRIQPNQDAVQNGIPITVTVTDKSTLAPARTSATTFLVNITDFNDPPTISTIPDVSVTAGQSSTNIAFTVGDTENSSINLTATSSDQTLVKNGNIRFNVVDGLPGSRTVQVTTEVGVVGSATITVSAKDGQKTTTTTFKVSVVESRERSFTNNRSIVINDNGAASDYPSIITVGSLVGDVASVRVGINGLAHRFPQDIDILLVSPDGKKALIMSDAGGGNAVTNINLTFDTTSNGAVPRDGTLASGSYLASNYDGASDAFPSPAPAGSYATSLNEFVGASANGDWKLYIVDDTATDSGVINGGWTLNITTKPKVVGLANVSVQEDESFRVPFTIVEESFVPLDFTFSTATTNAAVVRTNDITFSGSGTNWTLFGTPVSNASGSTEITVNARNVFGQIASGKFSVAVSAVNDRPFITDVADQTIFAGTTTPPIEFNFGDVETEKKNLGFTVETSNARLVPTNNVFIVGSVLTVAPIGGLSGVADITLTVTDASGASASTTFAVRVLPALNPQFANPTKITIRDNQKADPYPSTIEVTGVRGSVARVTVTLAEVNHPYPADVDILLVGPSGTNVVLLSDAGGSGKLENVRFNIDDRGSDVVPFNPSTPVPSGTYKPTNHQGADAFADAPAGPYGSALSAFAGTNPNGTWSLYVLDDASPDSGNIAGGWILNIFTTDPTILQIADQVTDENVPLTVPFRVEDADTPASGLATAAVTDSPDLLTLAITGTGNDRTLTITPAPFAFGTASVTVSVTDGTTVSSTTFGVTVNAVNQAPELTGLGDRISPVNVDPLLIPFQVFDRDSVIASVTTVAVLSKPSLGTLTSSGTGADRLLTFKPSGEQGQGFISVVASDGAASVTNTFSLVVGPPYELTFSNIGDQTVDENGITGINFSVGGSAAGTITVTGTSSVTSVVDRVTVTGTGTNFTATIRPRANVSGETIITLQAKDAIGGGTTSFKLTVLPLNGPTIQPIPAQRTPRNVAALVPLVVSDPDTAITSLLFTWTTSDTNVVRTVLFGQANGQVYADVRPVRDVLGEATVTIFVDDGRTKVGQAFLLTVFEPPNLPPVFGPVADQTTTANKPAVVALNITDPDTALADMVYGFRTSNPGLVSGVTVDTSTGSAVATVNLVTDATGIATVTITVNDGKNSVEQTFALSVTEADVEPPTLAVPTLSLVNGSLVITVTWEGGGTLEYATSPTGPWITTGNSSGSFSEPATGVQKYYRIKK
ncbi:MAG: proprotein convertase P-domain-containing protein [Verrucomicrobiales bacterium]|nr:proprotein convertase P-domain-containing protein [Verrucomicrobiales bacterium]